MKVVRYFSMNRIQKRDVLIGKYNKYDNQIIVFYVSTYCSIQNLKWSMS